MFRIPMFQSSTLRTTIFRFVVRFTAVLVQAGAAAVLGAMTALAAGASPAPASGCSYPPAVTPNPTLTSPTSTYTTRSTIELSGIGWPSGGTVVVSIAPQTEVSNAYPVAIGASGRLSVSFVSPAAPETLYVTAHCGAVVRTLSLSITAASTHGAGATTKAGTTSSDSAASPPASVLILILMIIIGGGLLVLQLFHTRSRIEAGRTPRE